MTKAETYEQAWRLGFKGDFSQVDSLYHPEYSAIDHTTSIKSNLMTIKLSFQHLVIPLFLVPMKSCLKVRRI